MNKTAKSIVITTGFLVSFLTLSSKALADCTPLYGGGYTCTRRGEIVIDKQIKNPSNDIFVDNLTQFDPKFSPNQDITFRILIKNTGDDRIDEIEVKDVMSDFATFVSGPGEFKQNDSKNGTLTFKINNLAASETREFWVKAKAFEAKNLPKDEICKLVNRAQARASGDRFTEDTAEFCITKTTTTTTKGGVTEVPKTGPEMILSAMGLSSLFGAGLFLRGKAVKLVK